MKKLVSKVLLSLVFMFFWLTAYPENVAEIAILCYKGELIECMSKDELYRYESRKFHEKWAKIEASLKKSE